MPNALDLTEPSLAEILYPGCCDEPVYGYSLLEDVRRPKGHSPVAVKAWLKTVLDAFEVKPTNWAKAAGLAPSTINRFVAHTDSSVNLSASTINKLTNALPSQIEQHLKDFWDKQAKQNQKVFSLSAVLAESQMLGFVTAEPDQIIAEGEGRDADLVDAMTGVHRTIVVPMPKEYHRLKTFGFEIASKNYEPFYNDFSIIICAPIFAYGSEPPNGSHVIVQELNDKRFLTTQIRVYVKDPTGRNWLMPLAGTASEGSKAIYVEDPTTENGPKATFLILSVYAYHPTTIFAQKSA